MFCLDSKKLDNCLLPESSFIIYYKAEPSRVLFLIFTEKNKIRILRNVLSAGILI